LGSLVPESTLAASAKAGGLLIADCEFDDDGNCKLHSHA